MENSRYKFRAWDIASKKFNYPQLWDNSMPTNWDKHYILNQYTGLKDKKGVEIYEGDILKGETTNHFASNRINNYKVIWGRDSWHIEKTYMSLQELFNYCDVGVEVIGNIFQTPELLK